MSSQKETKYFLGFYDSGEFRVLGKIISNDKMKLLTGGKYWKNFIEEVWYIEPFKNSNYKIISEDEALVWMI